MNKFPKLSTLFFATLLFVALTPLFGIEASGIVSGAVLVSNYLPMPVNVLGMNNTNNISAELAYEKAKKIFYNSFLSDFLKQGRSAQECQDWVNGLKLSQSEVRLEVELNAANTSFAFGLTNNDPNSNNVVFNTEKRLNLQDSLVVNEYGFYVGAPSSRTAVNWRERTYGNEIDFGTADAALIEQILYGKGSFRVTCNGDVIYPNRPIINNLYRPQTQMTAALGAASPNDQFRGAEDGLITMQPNMFMIGTKGYIPEVRIPLALTGLSGTFHRLIFVGKGVLAQNSTSFS